MRASHQSVNKSKKDVERERQFAKGGSAKMVKPQAAGPSRSGQTGKAQTAAPGARSAKGGAHKMSNFQPARSAKPGRTGVR